MRVRELETENNAVRSEVTGEGVAYSEEDDEELPNENAKTHQALVARANYLARGRSDIQFAAKELARSMAKPARGSWRA